jgi:hypothetical protein
MGVLACDRRGCENIMCDNYSHEHGYICWECLAELKTKPFVNIGDFMSSDKETHEEDSSDWEDIVGEEFKSRWEDNKDV